MDVFGVRDRVVADYRDFTSSFVTPRDGRIREHVDHLVASKEQWPGPVGQPQPQLRHRRIDYRARQ